MLHDRQSFITPLSWFAVFFVFFCIVAHQVQLGFFFPHSPSYCCQFNVDCDEMKKKNKNKSPMEENNNPRSPFTSCLAKVMSDPCQEEPNNDVTRRFTEVRRDLKTPRRFTD